MASPNKSGAAAAASSGGPAKIPGPARAGGSGPASFSNGGKANSQRLEDELTEEQKADIIEAFKLLDVENCSTIHAKDLKVALRALGYEPHRDKVKKYVSEADRESMSNTLMQGEFMDILKRKFFEQDEEEHEIAFPLFTEGRDFITIDDLRRIAAEIGEGALGDEILEEMIREADVLDHDGRISQAEFFRVLKRQNAHPSENGH